MAFDIGGLLGGGVSGAAAGSVFGPIGAVAGGLLGGIGGAVSGGGPAAYQMTPLQEKLNAYGLDQVRASPQRRRAIKSQFKSLVKSGNRGGAEAFLEAYRDRFSNPEFIEKSLARSYKKEVDYASPSYRNLAESVYGQQGIGYTADEYSGFGKNAESLGIRSPQAFADMLKRDLISSGKVMTPQQEMLSNIFGTPERDATGRLTNRYPTIAKAAGPSPIQAINYQYGA
jgi:hypothetical protein